MSANVIVFPTTKKVANGYSVSYSPNYGSINGIPVALPKTRKEYLNICKKFLEPEDYQDVLCGILDDEHYDALEDCLRNVVDSYYGIG